MTVRSYAVEACAKAQNLLEQAKVYKLDLSRAISTGSSLSLSQSFAGHSNAIRSGALLALLCFAPGAARPQQCADCHDVAQQMSGKPHATLECSTCHVGHEQYPHPAESPKITCDVCHGAVAGQFAVGTDPELVAADDDLGAPQRAHIGPALVVRVPQVPGIAEPRDRAGTAVLRT